MCSDSYSLFWALFASVCQSDLLQLMRVSKHFLWRCPIKVDGHQSERNDSLGWWQKADWFLLHKNKLFCLTFKKKEKNQRLKISFTFKKYYGTFAFLCQNYPYIECWWEKQGMVWRNFYLKNFSTKVLFEVVFSVRNKQIAQCVKAIKISKFVNRYVSFFHITTNAY